MTFACSARSTPAVTDKAGRYAGNSKSPLHEIRHPSDHKSSRAWLLSVQRASQGEVGEVRKFELSARWGKRGKPTPALA